MVRRGRRPKISLKPEELILAIWGENPEEEIAYGDLLNRIMEMFNVSRTTAIEYLGKLVKSGKLFKIKRGRHTYYRPTRPEDVVRWSLIGRLLTMAKLDDLLAIIIYGLWRLYEDNNKSALEVIKELVEDMLKDRITDLCLVDELKETDDAFMIRLRRLTNLSPYLPYLILSVSRELDPWPLKEKIKIGALLIALVVSFSLISSMIMALGLTAIFSGIYVIFQAIWWKPFLGTLIGALMGTFISFFVVKKIKPYLEMRNFQRKLRKMRKK